MSFEIQSVAIRISIRPIGHTSLYLYDFESEEEFKNWLGHCVIRMHTYMRGSTSAKIEMIKYCHEMRGWGLAEAKAFVEEFFPWLTQYWNIEHMREG